jgi:hypothetical protein
MTRPLTCLTLIAAAGAGLYLYQEKHRAQMMDREINRVVHATEQTRDRVTMVRAEWAVLNEPDRLAGLAAQYLSLQTMTPGQFVQVADLGSHLPPVGAPSLPPPAIEPAAPITPPLAAATPTPVMPATKPMPAPLVAFNVPRSEPARQAPLVAATVPKPEPAIKPTPQFAQLAKPVETAKPMLPLGQPGPAPVLPSHLGFPLMVQAKLPPKPKPPLVMAAAKPREPEPVYHQVYAPVVQAFASQNAPQSIRPPMVQQASAGLSQPYNPPAPFVGSALGMARTNLAAPVPVTSFPAQ